MKVNYRQISMMIFMSFIALKFLALPSLLFSESEYMSWFVALIMMMLDGVYAFLLVGLIKRNQDKNVLEFLNNSFGPVVSRVFLILLCGHFIIVMANLSKGLEFFVVENLYNEFKWFMFVLPLIGVVGYMMYKGIKNIARVFEMFFWAIIVGCIYIAVKSMTGVDVLVYLPFFKDGFTPILQGAYMHTIWFGSSTFLVMLIGCVDFKHENKKQLFRYIVFAIMLVMLLYFVFYGLFGITSPIHNYCLIDMSQYYTGSSSINELSWLVVSLWVVAQAIQLAMYGYCLMKAIMFIFNIKSSVIPIVVIDILLLFWAYLGTNTINLENVFFLDGVIIYSIIVQYGIPMLFIAVDVIKRKIKSKNVKRMVKHEKTKVRV